MTIPAGVIDLLNLHRRSFFEAEPLATSTGHTVPSDTKSWSQILASLLTNTKGLARQKGADLADGSDVKAANYWKAIDKPRFNGVVRAGRKGAKNESVASLDTVPFLYFVLWDNVPGGGAERCRVWAARPKQDACFRGICDKWYRGERISGNFQLHPPLNTDSNVFRNTCGNLEFPLLFRADWNGATYVATVYTPSVLTSGVCVEHRGG